MVEMLSNYFQRQKLQLCPGIKNQVKVVPLIDSVWPVDYYSLQREQTTGTFSLSHNRFVLV